MCGEEGREERKLCKMLFGNGKVSLRRWSIRDLQLQTYSAWISNILKLNSRAQEPREQNLPVCFISAYVQPRIPNPQGFFLFLPAYVLSFFRKAMQLAGHAIFPGDALLP